MRRRAFTLVELLVVIIVIAILAAMAVPKFAESGLRAREASLLSDLSLLRRSIDRCKTDTDLFPNSLKELALSVAPTNGLDILGNSMKVDPTSWQGPYLETIPMDPISGKDFAYSTAKGAVGDVRSSSPDKAIDGTAYASW